MRINKIDLDISFSINDAIKKIDVGQYNFVILDLNLPDGSGTDIIPYIKNKKNILILTADASTNTKKEIHNIGIKYLMTKPFNIKELLSIII